MASQELLAKKWTESTPPPDELTLKAHLRKVQSIGETICKTSGKTILESLGLSEPEWENRLNRGLRVAALFHDCGKANGAFQKMARGKLPGALQPARHELLAGLMMFPGEPLSDILLKELGETSWDSPMVKAVLGAIFGHHVKVDRAWSKAAMALANGGCGTDITIPLDWLEPALKDKTFSLIDDEDLFLGDYQIIFRKYNREWTSFLAITPEWQRFSAALKALLMAADALGSALPGREPSGEAWAQRCLKKVVVETEVDAVVKERLGGNPIRPFQKKIGDSTSRVVLVQAGCGSGKTLGAYLWAKKHVRGRKLFFCYPTTGTATEGFLGYVANGELEAELIHSRADIDLEGIHQSGEEDKQEERIKIASLNTWPAAVNICTVDTVLSIVRNGKKGLYASPALLSAGFVFDEVHAYDKRMFEAMLELMKALPGAPFLLMSASLPASRLKAIEELIPGLEKIESPVELEQIPRYKLERGETEELLNRVENCVRGGGKVLWVVNTVTKAQAVYDDAVRRGINTITYHSRFRYCDRVERHREVIAAFDKEGGGILAVTTQVAEMSLDLDADLLISELAPVPAMIQRLGRLNRRVIPEKPGEPRVAVFVDPAKTVPYQEEDLEGGRRWLDRLIGLGRPLSQADLAEVFRGLENQQAETFDLNGEWLNEGWLAEPGPIREPGQSVQVILAEDVESCLENRRELLLKAIPFNYNERRMKTWREVKNFLVAPPGSIAYSKERGASWQEN